jgi:hypothetical protein
MYNHRLFLRFLPAAHIPVPDQRPIRFQRAT